MLRSRTWYLEVEACEISTAGVCPKNTCHLKPKPKAGEERYKTLKSQGWEGQRDNIQMTCEASQVLDAQSNASSNLRFQERKPLQKHHGLWLKWGSLGSPTVVTCPWAFVDIWCPFPWAVAPFFYIPELHLSNMFTRVFFQIAVMKPLFGHFTIGFIHFWDFRTSSLTSQVLSLAPPKKISWVAMVESHAHPWFGASAKPRVVNATNNKKWRARYLLPEN